MTSWTLDLSTSDGITAYVETILIPDVCKIFTMRESVAPFGVALITMKAGEQFDRPIPEAVGVFGQSPKTVKGALRNVARLGKATGAIFIRQAEFPVSGSQTGLTQDAVVIQLEHRAFDDKVWSATIVGRKLSEFVRHGPLAGKVEVKPSAFLIERYMS